jgi:hypothetical protein
LGARPTSAVTDASVTSRFLLGATNPVRRAIDEHRRWKRDLLCELLAQDGCRDPGRTADVLTVFSDGLLVASHLDKPTNFRGLLHDGVTAILDAHRSD